MNNEGDSSLNQTVSPVTDSEGGVSQIDYVNKAFDHEVKNLTKSSEKIVCLGVFVVVVADKIIYHSAGWKISIFCGFLTVY